MKIFVIGNGESRKNFDLNLLKGKGIIVGCNAIYRDIKPHILVSMDGKYENKSCDYGIIKEIRENCTFLNELIYIYRKKNGHSKNDFTLELEFYKKVSTLKTDEITKFEITLPKDEGWASGPTAVLVLLRDIFPYHFFIQNLYLIGFDLSRLFNGKISSCYKGTDNYADSHTPGASHSTSAKQLNHCFNRFRDVNFKRVIDDINNYPIEWSQCGDNIKNITYEEFLNDIR